MTKKSHRAKRWRLRINIVLLLLIFLYIIKIVPLEIILKTILQTNIIVFGIGMIFSVFSLLFTSIQLWVFLPHQGIMLSPISVLAINLAIKFYGLFTPTSIVTSGIRWYRLGQPGDKIPEAIAATTFFRVLETFINISFGFGFLFISTQTMITSEPFWSSLVLIFIIILAWLSLVHFGLPLYHRFLPKTENIIKHKISSFILGYLERVLAAIATFSKIPIKTIIIALLTGVTSFILSIISGYFFALALEIPISFVDAAWVQALVILATQLPFTFANGLGIREATILTTFSLLGIPAEMAIAYSLLFFIKNLLISVSGGFIEAFRLLLRNQQVKSI